MKTILILFGLAIMSVLTHAHGNQFSYVITENDTIYCKKVDVGDLNLKCILQSGEKVKISYNNIQSYFDGHKTMVKLPVYLNGKKSGRMALMELVDSENGLRIYKYDHFNGSYDCWDAILNYYVKGECVCTQTNPSVEQIHDFIKSQGKDNKLNLFSKELSEK